MSLLLAKIKCVETTSVYYFGQFVGLLSENDSLNRAAIIQACCNMGVKTEELSVYSGASRQLRRAIKEGCRGGEKIAVLVPAKLEQLVNKKMPL